MKLRWLIPLTGILSAVLAIASNFIPSQGSLPDQSAPGSAVLAFYAANTQSQRLSAVLLVFTFIFLLAFAAFLWSWLHATPGAAAFSFLALVGACIVLVGQALSAGISFHLAATQATTSPDAAQALNVLQSALFFIYGPGFFIFAVGNGLAILSASLLPKWLGYIAILIGIVSITPLQGYGTIALVLWVLAVSFLGWRRLGREAIAPAA